MSSPEFSTTEGFSFPSSFEVVPENATMLQTHSEVMPSNEGQSTTSHMDDLRRQLLSMTPEEVTEFLLEEEVLNAV